MTNEILRSYFLGELDERAAETIERAVFDRQQIAEQALAVEAELFEDFAEARLSPGEREKFERNYLVTDARRAQLSVTQYLRREFGAHQSPNAFVAAPQQTFWQRFFGFELFPKSLAVAGFAILAMAVGGILFVLWASKKDAPEKSVAVVNTPQTDEKPTNLPNQVFENQNDQSQQTLPAAKTNSTENAVSNANLNSAIEKNKQNPVSPKQPPKVEQKPTTVAAIASTILTAGGLRGEASGEQTVKIPANAKVVNLKLVLPEDADAKNYRAEIATLERETVFTAENSRFSTGKNRQINLQIPARSLTAAKQYILFLKDRDGSSIAEYFFRVAAQDK